MGSGLLHLVQRGGDWAGPQPAQAPPCCTKCNSPPINGQYTVLLYNDPLLCGFNVPVKGLKPNRQSEQITCVMSLRKTAVKLLSSNSLKAYHMCRPTATFALNFYDVTILIFCYHLWWIKMFTNWRVEGREGRTTDENRPLFENRMDEDREENNKQRVIMTVPSPLPESLIRHCAAHRGSYRVFNYRVISYLSTM